MSLLISLPTCPVDEILSTALWDTVSSRSIPFSKVQIDAVDHPVPARWQTEVPIEGNVFSKAPPLASGPGWNGVKVFEASLARLGMTRERLNQLETDEQILAGFGEDRDTLQRMKKTVKNELKEYDSLFKADTGKDASRADKEPMRLLYTLYRRLRDLADRSTQTKKPDDQVQVATNRLEALYSEKQTVRAILQEYQAKFLSEQGRRIKYHRDIVSVDREYRQYKQIKEEIGRLETQLGRRPQDDDGDI